jgi:hypothetical protein
MVTINSWSIVHYALKVRNNMNCVLIFFESAMKWPMVFDLPPSPGKLKYYTLCVLCVSVVNRIFLQYFRVKSISACIFRVAVPSSMAFSAR